MGKNRRKLARPAARPAAPTRVELVDRPLPVTTDQKPVLNHRWDALMHLEQVAESARAALAAQDQAVRVARDRGASWVEVGNALGVTRQAARQRFGA